MRRNVDFESPIEKLFRARMRAKVEGFTKEERMKQKGKRKLHVCPQASAAEIRKALGVTKADEKAALQALDAALGKNRKRRRLHIAKPLSATELEQSLALTAADRRAVDAALDSVLHRRKK